MSYAVSWTVKAEKDLESLEESIAERIVRKVESIRDYDNQF